jgi:hypothetical protein
MIAVTSCDIESVEWSVGRTIFHAGVPVGLLVPTFLALWGAERLEQEQRPAIASRALPNTAFSAASTAGQP